MDTKTKILATALIFITFYSIGSGFYKYIILQDIDFYTETQESEEEEEMVDEIIETNITEE